MTWNNNWATDMMEQLHRRLAAIEKIHAQVKEAEMRWAFSRAARKFLIGFHFGQQKPGEDPHVCFNRALETISQQQFGQTVRARHRSAGAKAPKPLQLAVQQLNRHLGLHAGASPAEIYEAVSKAAEQFPEAWLIPLSEEMVAWIEDARSSKSLHVRSRQFRS
jgi:hypothetical protein